MENTRTEEQKKRATWDSEGNYEIFRTPEDDKLFEFIDSKMNELNSKLINFINQLKRVNSLLDKTGRNKENEIEAKKSILLHDEFNNELEILLKQINNIVLSTDSAYSNYVHIHYLLIFIGYNLKRPDKKEICKLILTVIKESLDYLFELTGILFIEKRMQYSEFQAEFNGQKTTVVKIPRFK